MNAAISKAPKDEATTLYLDLPHLWEDKIRVMERGSPNTVVVHTSGELLRSNQVVIVNPETCKSCGAQEIGEIWLASDFNRLGYTGVSPDTALKLTEQHMRCQVPGSSAKFARTGLLGFFDRHLLYVTGSIEESFFVQDMRHNPCLWG